MLSHEIARRLKALPISHHADGSVVLAIADPATVVFSDELRGALGSATHFTVVGPEALEAALAFVYSHPFVRPVAADVTNDEHWQGVVVELRSDESTTTTELVDDASIDTSSPSHHGPPLGALLLREGFVTDEELRSALTQQSLSTSWRLGEILVDRGVVTAADVARLIAEQYELPYTELTELHIEPHVAALLPRQIAREFPAVPIAAHPDGSLEVAIADPTDVYYSDDLHNALGVPLTFVVASPAAIEAILETVHAPVAVVELVTDDEDVSIGSEVTFDQAESVAAEDAEEFVNEREDLPEFVIELVAVEEPAAVEEVAVPHDEAEVAQENFRWRPVWMTEFQPADDTTELDEVDDDPVEAPEATDTDADELATVLLAEVAETHEPTERVSDSEDEISLALVEVEHELELDEADAAVEPAEFERAFALVEFEHDDDLETTVVDEAAESEAEPDTEAVPTLVETEHDEEFLVNAMVDEPAESEMPIALLDGEPFDGISESVDARLEPEQLDVEDSTAYADDLDTAIDEVLALGASAIHFSPQGEWHTVRARIDGLVRELGVVAKEDLESLVERVETSAAMRVDVIPTKQGDKVVLFPREQAGSPRVLAELGLTGDAADALRAALSLPSGAVLVSGPVGSGTTTTLYATLDALNTPECVLASIEDPVERVLDGIDQTEVDLASGATVADRLRTLLSTDSDIVLVGEIRDHETAELALQAAIDGHHILAGLRAPTAAGAIRRLADLGIEPIVLGGALTCVVSQRLVRRVCNDCRETYYASDTELAELGQSSEGNSPRLLARGRGCDSCDGTGFRGRIGLFEILSVTDEIRALVYDGASAKKIHRAAIAAGMQTLHDDGVRLCLEGMTTAAEVQRILGAER
jgi:type II secretory ATPase GspE/PulE/Tfp pilus assembly ATPase PilB-like protein